MNSQDQIIKIQKTANTLFDLRDHTDIKYCREISDIFIEKIGNDGIRLSTSDFMAFIVSRFITTQNYLQLMSDRHKSNLQIIELGSGFTPHFLNLNSFTGKYIEVDLEENSHLKQEIMKQLTDAKNLNFVAGDIASESTWKIIAERIDIEKPVIVFCEGVIAHYFDSDQKIKIGKFVKKLLSANGSSFVIDDTLRNHPELHKYDVIKNGMTRVTVQSGSKVYTSNEDTSFQSEMDKWEKIFNNDAYTIDYVLSKPEMDFAISQFKLIVCCNDASKDLEPILKNMSKINKQTRVWK
jgi:hypothetical protein